MFSIGLALCKMTRLEVQGFTERKILRAMSNREAEVMFWMTPELVEHLLSFLDPASILALAKAHPLTREVLQRGLNWTRFLERSCPKQSFTLRPRFQRLLPPEKPWWTHKQWIVSLMQHYVTKALEPIIEILLLIGKPESQLLQLLDRICKNFPPYIESPDHVKRSMMFHLLAWCSLRRLKEAWILVINKLLQYACGVYMGPFCLP